MTDMKSWVRPGRKGFDIDYVAIAKIYMETDEEINSLAQRFGVSKWTLISRFKKLGAQKTTRRFQNNNVFFEFTQESCYWAGFVAADGNVSNDRLSIELCILDKNHLGKFVSYLQGNNKICEREKKSFGKKNKSCSVHINSKNIISDLKNNFNIIENKSLVIEPPENIPEEYIRHFIRGYIDGDGSIGWKKNDKRPRVMVCSGSFKLIEWISNNIKKYNSGAGNPKIRTKGKLNFVEFSNKKTYDILDWLYKDSTEHLDRKYARYVDYLSRRK
jgi:hypothetical protein